MIQCQIVVTQEGEQWRHTCEVCGWSKVFKLSMPGLQRNCRPQPAGQVNVVANVPRGCKWLTLPSGIRCYRANVYSVPQSDVDAMADKLSVVTQDGSRVGTRLRVMFSSLGFGDKPGCSCAAVRDFLDHVDLAYIKSHKGELVELIRQSAASVGVNVPSAAIHLALASAVLIESYTCHQDSTPG